MPDCVETTDQPLFVVGALRSGTTLLNLMLGGHPEICNFGEFEYAVSHSIGDEFPDMETYRVLLEADRLYRAHGFDIDAALSYRELVESFLYQAYRKGRKPIVSATIHSRFDLLPRLWPNARFLHLVRDPRDVSRSCIGMGWVGNVWYGADIWVEAEHRWSRLKKEISRNNYIEIRFEDLVANAEGVLSQICRFLGLEYSQEMLSYPKYSTYDAPDPKLANQWKRHMPMREIQLVEYKCKPVMESLGYAADPTFIPVKLPERVLLYVDHRTKRWGFNLKRYGAAMCLQWLLARRFGGTRFEWSRDILRRIDEIKDANAK